MVLVIAGKSERLRTDCCVTASNLLFLVAGFGETDWLYCTGVCGGIIIETSAPIYVCSLIHECRVLGRN